MSELKPCPFCGSSGALDECPSQGDWDRLFWIECRGEDCGIHGRIRHTPEAAIAAWNRRPSSPT